MPLPLSYIHELLPARLPSRLSFSIDFLSSPAEFFLSSSHLLYLLKVFRIGLLLYTPLPSPSSHSFGLCLICPLVLLIDLNCIKKPSTKSPGHIPTFTKSYLLDRSWTARSVVQSLLRASSLLLQTSPLSETRVNARTLSDCPINQLLGH